MLVKDYLDRIFFGDGQKCYLDLLKNFAGIDGAEMLGLCEDYASDSTRVLLIVPEVDEKGQEKKDSVKIYLSDVYLSGGCICKPFGDGGYSRNVAKSFYSALLADKFCNSIVRKEPISTVISKLSPKLNINQAKDIRENIENKQKQ